MWIACVVWSHFYYQIYYYDLYVKSVESGHKAKSILFWTLKGLGLFIVVVFGQYFIIKLYFSIFTSTDKNPPQTFTCCYSLVSGDGHYHHLRHAQRPTNHCLPVWSSLFMVILDTVGAFTLALSIFGFWRTKSKHCILFKCDSDHEAGRL